MPKINTLLQNQTYNLTTKQLRNFIVTDCHNASTSTKIAYDKNLNSLSQYKSIIPVVVIKIIEKFTIFLANSIETFVPIKCRLIRIVNKWATNRITKLEDTANALKYMGLIPKNFSKKYLTIGDFQNIFIENNRYISDENSDDLAVGNFLHADKTRLAEFNQIVDQTTDLILDYGSNIFLKKVLEISSLSDRLCGFISSLFNKIKAHFLKKSLRITANAMVFSLLKLKIQNTQTPEIETIKSISPEINNIFNRLNSENKLQPLKSIDELLEISDIKYKIYNPQKHTNLAKLFENNNQLFKNSLTINPKEQSNEYIARYADNLEFFIIAIIGTIIPIVKEALTSKNVSFFQKMNIIRGILS